MIDLCTVVYDQELNLLEIQARSLQIYSSDEIGTIYVAVNDKDHVANKINRFWWGDLYRKVKIVKRSEFGLPWINNYGWISQQVLKLLVPTFSKAEYTLVLDAKTILIGDIWSRLFNRNNRIMSEYIEIHNGFEQHKKLSAEIFNYPTPKILYPAGVPFIFHNPTVCSMIDYLKNNVDENWTKWFQTTDVTEFILYSVWVGKTKPPVHNFSTPPSWNCVNISKHEYPFFDQIFSMVSSRTMTVSVHIIAWDHLIQDQKSRFNSLLIDRGVIC